MIEAPLSMTVTELDRLHRMGADLFILDVREQWERDIAMLPGSLHIPLGTLQTHFGDLPLDRQVVIMCHHGGRSAQATSWLRQNGFAATNLEGGIDAWSQAIDPGIPRY